MGREKIDNKVIWITGASSGIGKALVLELAEKNVQLVISSRKEKALEDVRNCCPEQVQPNIHILPLDLKDAHSLPEKAEAAIKVFGRIDIIIHSGGISQRAFAADTGIEVDRVLMEVNYFGGIALTKALLPVMISNGFGHIVAVSSLMGKFSSPFRSGYAASKHALHGFYDALRAETFKDNIFVSIITPGFIKTDVSVNALNEKGEATNVMDEGQANGMEPGQCAKRIIDAIEKQKNEVLIGGKEIFAVYIKRFFPRILARIIRNINVR